MSRRFVSLEPSRNETTFGERSFLPRHSTARKQANMAANVGAYLERFFPAGNQYDELDGTDPAAAQERWLKKYYFARVAFSAVWVAAAFTVGSAYYVAGAVLLVVYPLWDAVANLVDAQRSGGLARNQTQAINLLVSLATTGLAVLAVMISMHWVFGVYGAWAILSGLMQLGSAVRRWRTAGAQWAQILSGAQSSLAGGFFIFQATQDAEPSIDGIAGYAAFGAFYFLVSALWLTVKGLRAQKPNDQF
ncbi:putative membrane protein [Rosellinia necatrix]|uniref:Putative membrane protein n=1 Tax=Rosellinia necatrix TaxID=77044 RepID=A0A1W2TCA8_ROSNE|nr:putative membrane protein [Rosellinia necatrix]